MKRIEKTVFISYRRTNAPWALAIYQHLRDDYDVFFDFTSIPSGDFEQVIFQNIKARAHFIVLLTPSALKRCNNPNDLLRREIECALDNKRNIIPLMLEGFDFGIPAISKHLSGKLELIKNYNAMTVPVEYFDAAMTKLRDQFLSVPLDTVLHPVSKSVEEVVRAQKKAANFAPKVLFNKLSALFLFEKGNFNTDPEEQIRCYTEAIKLNPEYADAYYNRGIEYAAIGQYERAIEDFNKTIEINPEDADAYSGRGISYSDFGQHEQAIEDFDKVIEIDPEYAKAYFGRGICYTDLGQYKRAIEDYDKAIEIDLEDVKAYNNRGISYIKLGQYERAIEDFDKAIEINPEDANAYTNRGSSYAALGQYQRAIEDFDKAIGINPEDDGTVFNTACTYALQHQTQLACTWLRKAINMESQNFELAKTDKDFNRIRDTLEFQELLKEFEHK